MIDDPQTLLIGRNLRMVRHETVLTEVVCVPPAVAQAWS